MTKFRNIIVLLVVSLLMVVVLVACSDVATTTPTASTGVDIPTIPGATSITLDPAVASNIKSSFGSQFASVTDLTFKVYGSDSDPATLTTNLDKTLTGVGYKFGVPGMTAPIQQGSATLAFYVKAGSPDLFFILGDPKVGFGVNGLDAKTLQTMASDLATKKSAIILVSGTGLISSFMAASGAGAGAGADATPTKSS
jgi:hypothetical protein